MDISNFMAWFIAQVVRLVTFFFSLLANVTFLGTSLMRLIVDLLILGVVLDVLIVSVKSRSVRDVSGDDKKNKKGESDDSK